MELRNIAHNFLDWANIYNLSMLIAVGFTCFYRKIFGRAIVLMFLSMIFNPVLKAFWQIPLSPSLDTVGWAFPSGHMQTLTVLVGWVAWEWNKRWIQVLSAGVLAILGYAIIAAGYHNVFDILGGFVAGIFMIACLAQLNKRWHWIDQHPEFLGLLTLPLTLGMLYWLATYDTTINHYHCYAALGGLIALSFAWTVSAHFEIPSHWLGKTLLGLVVAGGMWQLGSSWLPWIRAHYQTGFWVNTVLSVVAPVLWMSFIAPLFYEIVVLLTPKSLLIKRKAP